MRTTLTINDALAESLKRLANQSGKSFKQVVNETLLNGLAQTNKIPERRYQQKAFSLGQPSPGINLDKALLLADELEDKALIHKMEQRK